MKIGSIVTLKPEPIKRFYSTYKNSDMYYRMSFKGNLDLEADDFVSYVDDILSFENGEFGALVTYINDNSVTVKYKSVLTRGWLFGYYELEDLQVVME
jgi:uncharacterized protein YkvS